MNQHRVSVVMPSYNAEGTITASIDSVIAQTFTDWELLVVDDGSNDSTEDILKEYLERDESLRIRYIKKEQNSGASDTRNVGVSAAQTDWIAFLDSDDLWAPDKLECQFELLEKYPDASLAFTGSGFITNDSEPLDYVLEVPETITFRQLLKQNVISCSSVLIRRELMQKYPMQDDSMHEDFAVWLQVLRDGYRAVGVNEPLLIYRLSLSSKSSNKLKAAGMTWKVYRYIGLSVLESFYYFCWYAVRSSRKYTKLGNGRKKH